MAHDVRRSIPFRRRAGHLVGLAVFLVLLGLWLYGSFVRPDLIWRDWVAFDQAGWRALGGDWSSVYRASANEQFPYLYPPFAIVLALPLGLVPFWPSYVITVAAALAGIGWSCRRLTAVLPNDDGRWPVFCVALLCAPTTLQVIITGQYSWIYFTSLCGLAAGLHDGDERRAGYSLALLCLKPNLAVAVIPMLLIRRQWPVLRRATRATFIVVAATLPFTLFAWGDFAAALRGVAERQELGDAPIEKQVTLLAFLRVVSGQTAGAPAITTLWLAIVAVAAILVAHTWRRAGAEVSAVRLSGLAALCMVALSPRLYFYDALVLAVPAAAWYLGPGCTTRRWIRRLEGLIIAAIVGVTFLFFPLPSVVTVVGPLAGLWLLLEVFDLRSGLRRHPRAVPTPSELTLAS
jgi:hypothetical protein